MGVAAELEGARRVTQEHDVVGAWLARAERAGMFAIGAGTVAMFALACAGVWLFVPELDEAWLLFGLQSLARGEAPPGMQIPVVVTSAGVFAAIHATIEWLAGNALWAHRLVSILCLGTFLTFAYRAGARAGGDRSAGLLCAGAAAATPGAVIFGSQAFAEPIALLLLLAFSTKWCSRATTGRRWLLAGVLLGLALATRSAVLPMLPAALLFWLLQERTRASLAHTAAALAAAVIVAMACQALYLALSPGPAPLASHVLGLVGASSETRPGLLSVLKHLALGTRLAPLCIAVAAFVAALWIASRERGSALALLLACLALAQLGGWTLFSPKPLLRYAWPGLPLLWLAFGIVAAHAWAAARIAGAPQLRAIVVAAVLGALASESIWPARVVSYGESSLIAAEYAGFTGLERFRPFKPARDHANVVRFLRAQVGEKERVWVLHLPFPLAYATGLDVAPRGPEGARPEWLVLTPGVGMQRRLTPGFEAWVERNCELRLRSGRYSIYRVRGVEPLPHEQTTNSTAHPL
jgi:hypothetical protein